MSGYLSRMMDPNRSLADKLQSIKHSLPMASDIVTNKNDIDSGYSQFEIDDNYRDLIDAKKVTYLVPSLTVNERNSIGPTQAEIDKAIAIVKPHISDQMRDTGIPKPDSNTGGKRKRKSSKRKSSKRKSSKRKSRRL